MSVPLKRRNQAYFQKQAAKLNVDNDSAIIAGIDQPQEVLKCARKLVNAMAIPAEYWRRWAESMYALATNLDIMQQLTHQGKPMVKAVGSIYNVDPDDLSRHGFLLEKETPRTGNQPAHGARPAKAGDIRPGADGNSMFIKTDAGKWLEVANMPVPAGYLKKQQARDFTTEYDTYHRAEAISNAAGQARPLASTFGMY